MDIGVMEKLAEVMKALAHPVRLMVLESARRGPVTVAEIARSVGRERSVVLRHLQKMVQVGVLHARRQGKTITYSLTIPCVLGFLECAQKVLSARVEGEVECLQSIRSATAPADEHPSQGTRAD